MIAAYSHPNRNLNPNPSPNPGAPMIAAALKETCDKLSDREKTVFRLHKENF